MQYTFPTHLTLDDVRSAIADKPEFVENNRGNYIVFNYHVNFPDSFPDITTDNSRKNSILRECRGLIFSADGEVISRRYHKFFNINERAETLEPNIIELTNTNEYTLLEKLDGSMITPLIIDNNLRWASKAGIDTDVALEAENHIATINTKYTTSFAIFCSRYKLTPIFEYMSPSNRIVISYAEPTLVLTAIRNNISGKYVPYDDLKLYAREFNLPVVSTSKYDIHSVRDMIDTEGLVLVFSNGHRVKAKTPWYVNLHKMKENFLFEKSILKVILENKIDDILSFVSAEDQNKIKLYHKSVKQGIKDVETQIKVRLTFSKKRGESKKDFALFVAPKLNPMIRSLCFSHWDNTDNLSENIIKYMLNSCSTQSSIDRLHELMHFNRWEY